MPEWLQGSIGAAATLLVAWLSYLGVKRKSKAEERSTSVESQAKSLETLLDGLTERVENLERQLAEMRTENRTLEQENLALRLQVRHKDDVLDAFARWLRAWEEHERQGSPDPPGVPPYSWQMRQHLEEAAVASLRLQEPPPD